MIVERRATMRGVMTMIAVALAAGLALAACAQGQVRRDPALVSAAQLVDVDALQSPSGGFGNGDYRIGATDTLSVIVFQVPDLTFTGPNALRVDAAGNIAMPLIGVVPAAGLTSQELSASIASRLGQRYLRNPHVTVAIDEAASQKVTVDGSVNKPGVYLMRGRTTLLQAVAMAEGPTQIADTRSVAVFRAAPEGRMVALFDLGAIRAGQADDPVLQGDDVVVVDVSRLNAAFRDIVAILPGLGAFVYYIRD